VPLNEQIAGTFGYGALTAPPPRGRGPLRERPAVVAIVDYEGGARFPADQDSFLAEYFDTSATTAGAVLKRMGAPLRHVGGGTMPPIVQMSTAERALPEPQRVDLVAHRLVHDVFGPTLFMENLDLIVICFDNFSPDGGANRVGHVTVGIGPHAGAQLSITIAFFALAASLRTRLHEVLHSLGGIDVYGHDGNRNYRHSIMSSGAPGGDRETVLPDPWHRLAWQLTAPDIWEVAGYLHGMASFEVGLRAASNGAYPALLLWDAGHSATECLIVELRDNASTHDGLAVDSGVAPGFVLWLLSVDAAGIPVLRSAAPAEGNDRAILTVGSPELELGGWDPWVPAPGSVSVSTPQLRWLDDSPTGFSLTMTLDEAGAYASGTLRFEPFIEFAKAPVRLPLGGVP